MTGASRRMVINWTREAEKGLVSDHALAPVVGSPGRPGGPSFTKIQSAHHIRGDVGLPLYTRMAEQFGHIYRPALEDGVRITLCRFKDYIEVRPELEPTRRMDQPALTRGSSSRAVRWQCGRTSPTRCQSSVGSISR